MTFWTHSRIVKNILNWFKIVCIELNMLLNKPGQLWRRCGSIHTPTRERLDICLVGSKVQPKTKAFVLISLFGYGNVAVLFLGLLSCLYNPSSSQRDSVSEWQTWGFSVSYTCCQSCRAGGVVMSWLYLQRICRFEDIELQVQLTSANFRMQLGTIRSLIYFPCHTNNVIR